MGGKRSWTDDQLIHAVEKSRSIRAVLILLKLVPAGGNYDQVKKRILELKVSTEHFTGMGWRVASTRPTFLATPLDELLVLGSNVQSYKLKNRLFMVGLKSPVCELCGWAEQSADGRVPVELDHINGDHMDNRLDNLRILCPNCHSLQPTHRGKNKRRKCIVNVLISEAE